MPRKEPKNTKNRFLFDLSLQFLIQICPTTVFLVTLCKAPIIIKVPTLMVSGCDQTRKGASTSGDVPASETQGFEKLFGDIVWPGRSSRGSHGYTKHCQYSYILPLPDASQQTFGTNNVKQ